MPSKNSHGRKFVDWSIHHIKRMLDNPVYTGRIAFGRTRLERVEETENEYRRVKSDDYILSDEVVHEPIISDELFEAAKRKRQETTTTGNPRVGRYAKHLLSGILKCPMLLVFDKIFDKMNDVDKRKLIESMIAEVHLHPKETWEEGKNPIKEIKCAFPVSKEVMDALRKNVASVETVVLLFQLKQKPDDYINVTIELDDMDITSAETKATYDEIKEYVFEHNAGMKVSNLYISQVKRKCGIEVGKNYNLPKNEDSRQPQCPEDKERAIVEALKHFKMIQQK